MWKRYCSPNLQMKKLVKTKSVSQLCIKTLSDPAVETWAVVHTSFALGMGPSGMPLLQEAEPQKAWRRVLSSDLLSLGSSLPCVNWSNHLSWVLFPLLSFSRCLWRRLSVDTSLKQLSRVLCSIDTSEHLKSHRRHWWQTFDPFVFLLSLLK